METRINGDSFLQLNPVMQLVHKFIFDEKYASDPMDIVKHLFFFPAFTV